MIASGFSVSGAIPRRCAASSSVTPASRSGVSASSASLARRSASTSGPGLPRAFFSAFSSALSITPRSASSSSPRTVSSSSTGEASPPKHRSTTASASTSRNFAMPWALDTPPGTSTNRTCAATVFFEDSMSVSTCRRGSGTGTTAMLAWPPCEPARVIAVNSVLFPLNGTPTSPTSFTVGEPNRASPADGPSRSLPVAPPFGPQLWPFDHCAAGVADADVSLRDRAGWGAARPTPPRQVRLRPGGCGIRRPRPPGHFPRTRGDGYGSGDDEARGTWRPGLRYSVRAGIVLDQDLVSQKILPSSSIASRSCWPCAGSVDFLASPASFVAFQNLSCRSGYFSTCSGLK